MSTTDAIPRYRERLAPGPLLMLLTAAMGASWGLVVAPYGWDWAAIVAAVMCAITVAAVFFSSPVIEIDPDAGVIRAGRAVLPAEYAGTPRALSVAELKDALGIRADARDYMCQRGWINQAVAFPITDEADPTPRWIICTRHPERLVRAIEALRAHAH